MAFSTDSLAVFTDFPDVRRNLLWMKSYVEGMRSFFHYVAKCGTKAEIGETEEEREFNSDLFELMTPVIKNYLGTYGHQVCVQAIQVYGGAGYSSDYLVEQYAIRLAREKVSETGEITREEAEKISDYLKRDLQNAGEYMQDNNNDMADWLHMDIDLIEWNLLDLFLQTADKTKLELLLLEENAKHVNEYLTGEITGPGTLVCTQCNEELHFLNTGHVPPCPKCRSTLFKRKSR